MRPASNNMKFRNLEISILQENENTSCSTLDIKARFLPVNDLSSWQRAKSHTLTVVSSEHEQNFRSVLEKLPCASCR